MAREAAEAVRNGGEPIIFGAPNAARGGSHMGSLGAGDMVEAGRCDGLAPDSFYPAMLAAVVRLDAENARTGWRCGRWSPLVQRGPWG